MDARRIPIPHADPQVTALIDEYFERRRSGEPITPEAFAAEHPELAGDLRPYLEGLSLLDEIGSFAGEGVGEETDGGDAGPEVPAIAGYELLEEIGRGGMGVVYKALQISTKRIVAIKVLLAGPFVSSSGRKRFEREVELAARLQHANIVRVLESGGVGMQQYYAMEYVEGIPLDRYVSTGRPDTRSLLHLLCRVGDVVDYAHAHGVIHRDLKPANVLIDAEGEPHILDFGLAKAVDEAGVEETVTVRMSQSGQVMGTLPYLSPEQASGQADAVDARTDVYALGVMMFEALTGTLPFDPETRPSELLRSIIESPPASPSSISGRVDGELETIILKALEKDRLRRFQSPSEMVADVRRYLAGEPIHARRPSHIYVLRKKLRKHRWPIAVAAGLVAVVVVGGSLRLWNARQDLSAARRATLAQLLLLERGAGSRPLGPVQALIDRHGNRLPEAQLVWARTHYDIDHLEDAILFLERGLESDPSRWFYRLLLGEIYDRTGNVERAEELRRQAEREAPDSAEAWYLRSFAMLGRRDALRATQAAIDRDPSHALAWRRLIGLRLDTGHFEDALRGADTLIGLGDSPAEWALFKGHVLVRQGRVPEAIEHYSRLVTTDPEGWRALLHRAHAYRRIGSHEQAIADYDAVIAHEAKEAVYLWHLYQRATPLWIVGRPEDALDDYVRVRNLLGRPFYADARRFLILRELGREEEAATVLADALRDVDDPWLEQIFRCLAGDVTPDELVADAAQRGHREQLCEAHYYAAEACLHAGRPADARRRFEQCLATGVAHDLDVFPPVPMNEYELARWRLETLVGGEAGSAPQENPGI